MSVCRKYLLTVGLAGLLSAVTACANSAPPAQAPASAPPAASDSASAPPAAPGHAVVTGTFATDGGARNYDKTLVPDGAKVLVAENVFDGTTTVTLSVHGLVPNRAYGAHAHAKPCGPTGEDAGSHYQNMADPTKPSVDPKYANVMNEIWLDFKTDAQGNATSARTVPWTFSATPAGSVVIHAEPTQTAPGKAGTAGARAACVSVKF